MSHKISRRMFLRALGLTVASASVARAAPEAPETAAHAPAITHLYDGDIRRTIRPGMGAVITRYGAASGVTVGQLVCIDCRDGNVLPARAGDIPIGIALSDSENGVVDVQIMGQMRIE